MVKCNNCGKELKEAIKILEEFLLILGSEYCYIDNRDTTKEEQAMETVLKYIKEESIPKAVLKKEIEEIKGRKMDIVTSPIHSTNEKLEILEKDQIRKDILQKILKESK